MADLAHVLRHLPRTADQRLLAGAAFGDDAAIYQLNAEIALIQSVDFFAPIVDDPYSYGQIAAANALSDIYAMGGQPLVALNIVAFPLKSLPSSILQEILKGGSDKVQEAGASIIGGHTIEDDEPKYGLAVTGTVSPDRFVPSAGAKAGDRLILTKPIGTGVIATAGKERTAPPGDIDEAIRWMSALNRDAATAMLAAGAHAATDVTGFGLLGHLSELARASGLAAEIDVSAVPLLPGALELARAGHIPGGTQTNLDALRGKLKVAGDIGSEWLSLLADPQTSGGLLVTLPDGAVPAFEASITGQMLAAVVGKLEAREGRAGHVQIS